MNKKIIFAVLLISFVLLISGCGKTPSVMPKVSDRGLLPLCEKFKDSLFGTPDLCKAYLLENPSYCEKIKDIRIKAGCYGMLARKTNNAQLCVKSSLPYKCYFDVAVETGDASICPEAGIEKGYDEFCYEKVAEKTKNPALCEKSGKNRRDYCYSGIAIATKNSALCEKAGNSKSSCYFNLAPLVKDATLCKNVVEFLRGECYEDVAIATNDLSLCSKSENPTRCRAFIEKDMATIKAQDIQCRYTYGAVLTCATPMAIKTKDITICNEEMHSRDCVQMYLSKAGLPTAAECNQLVNDEVQSYCLKEVAVADKDVSLCQQCRDMDNKNICYAELGPILGDISLCEKSYLKERCYTGVAAATRDASICEEHFSQEEKIMCYSAVIFGAR